jgi:hypothetical protein
VGTERLPFNRSATPPKISWLNIVTYDPRV